MVKGVSSFNLAEVQGIKSSDRPHSEREKMPVWRSACAHPSGSVADPRHMLWRYSMACQDDCTQIYCAWTPDWTRSAGQAVLPGAWAEQEVPWCSVRGLLHADGLVNCLVHAGCPLLELDRLRMQPELGQTGETYKKVQQYQD